MSEWIDIGEQLREKRESRDLELMDVAHETRIPLATLAALEKNDYSIFPSPAYARSFLAQYSDYLDVDAHEWIDAFETGDILSNLKEHSYLQAEHDRLGGPHQGAAPQRRRNRSAHEYHSMPTRIAEKSNTLQTLTVLFVTTLLIAAGIYAYKKYEPMLTGERHGAPESMGASQASPTATHNENDHGNALADATATATGPANPAGSSPLIAHYDLSNNTGGGVKPVDTKNQLSLQAPTFIQPDRNGPPPKALIIEENED